MSQGSETSNVKGETRDNTTVIIISPGGVNHRGFDLLEGMAGGGLVIAAPC